MSIRRILEHRLEIIGEQGPISIPQYDMSNVLEMPMINTIVIDIVHFCWY